MYGNAVALLTFFCAYGLFVAMPARRSIVSVAAALVLLVCGVLSPREMVSAINWNVMGIFLGTLIAAEAFIASRFPAYFAEIIVNRAPNTTWAILFICGLTSFISAFVENVATVLIVAPIGATLAAQLGFNPDPFLMAVAVGAACDFLTPIGHQCNTLVMGPGGYRFADYPRLGAPLSLLVLLAGPPLILLFWPL